MRRREIAQRELQIPLVLWIATAIVVHLFWGGGTHQVAMVLEEKTALRDFAARVQREVQAELRPIPIVVLERDVTEPPKPVEPPKEAVTPQKATDAAEKKRPDDSEKKEPEKELEKPSEPKPPDLPEAKQKTEPPTEKPKAAPPELELERKRAISVRQHVENENQPDNPNAKFLGNKANKVAEETQARITSTDQDDPKPNPGSGSPDRSPTAEPGNADDTRVASSAGESDDGSPLPAPRDEAPEPQPPPPVQEDVKPSGQKQQAPEPPQQTAPRPATPPDPDQTPEPTVKAAPDIVAGTEGDYSLGAAVVPKPKKEKRLPPPKATKPKDLLGLGSAAMTQSGVNLNLSHDGAVAVIGERQLREDRRMDQLSRRSKRRGNWKMIGLERWRSAIENYVPMVKPGNTTALNTAYSPFATYLNDVHNRIHPVFADTFLVALDQFPSSHSLNRPDLVTHAEIVLSSLDGSLVKAGIVKSSGVTAFDVNALEAVYHASPFGRPPTIIVSYDGNVYLHWEFYRNPYYACSTYFAHPYLLKAPGETNQPKPDSAEHSPKELPGPRVPPG